MYLTTDVKEVWSKFKNENYFIRTLLSKARSKNLKFFFDSKENPKAFLVHEDKGWDSEVLGFKVGSIPFFYIVPAGENGAKYLVKEYSEWLVNANYKLVSARIKVDEVSVVQALEFAGFRYVEVYLTFERDLIKNPPKEDIEDIIDIGRPEDAKIVGEIASKVFIYDRLHTDPVIEKALGDIYKKKWGENTCMGYADIVFVVRVKDQVVGFISVKRKKEKFKDKTNEFAVIDLIGIDHRYQGMGFGKKLVDTACKWAKNSGFNIVRVGTQASNKPSIILYKKTHFDIVDFHLTLHWSQ